MAELTSGFFNAVLVDGKPDRVYSAEQVNDYFKGLISENGIFATISNACQVMAGSGMNVVVKTGRGKVGSNWFEIEYDTTLSIANSDVILDRIDSVVIQRDLTNRNVNLYIKQGTLSSNPVAPTLTRNDTIYEICLANIRVGKNVSSISQSAITDTRSNNSVCGWITTLIDTFDTTTLFNQYQNAQNDFINDQTSQFNTWFNGIKDTVKATSLYREYKASYTTTTTNESTFTIPSSINFVNNGLDVLDIYINGFRFRSDEYSINSAGTQVTLTQSLNQIGTVIEFVNKKSVEGTVAESTVTRVEDLETKVNQLTSLEYIASGSDDNITLSNMVKAFLNGNGNYTGVADNANLRIEVVGTLGITSLIDSSYVFDFNSATSSNRKVVVDFSRATIPNITFTSTTLAILSCTDNVKTLYANIKATQKANQTLYVFHGGTHEYANVNIIGNSGTFYGAWGCQEVSNSEFNISNATGTVYVVYSCTKVLYNTLKSNTGTSIRASGKQLLLGNFVNQAVNVDSTVTNIGTITL